VQAAEFSDPPKGRCRRYSVAMFPLFRVDPFDLVGRGGGGKARIDADHKGSLPRNGRCP
jgi:hypothetical protein